MATPGLATPASNGEGMRNNTPAAANEQTADPHARLREAASLAAALPLPTAMAAGSTSAATGTPQTPPTPTAEDAPRRSTRERATPARLVTWNPHGNVGEDAAARVSRNVTWADGATGTTPAGADHRGADHRVEGDGDAGTRTEAAAEGIDGTAYAAYSGPNHDKTTLAQARREPDWDLFDIAVEEQMDAMWDGGVFELAWLPEGESVLPFQILCERKRNKDGDVHRRKGRGVVCGNFQVPGRDFGDVHAPVVHRATLLATLAHAASAGMLMHQLDVETAFLNGPLDEELYVRQPKGYERRDKGQVLRLRRAISCLQQAARQWFLELVKLMRAMGMRQSAADPCLFLMDIDGKRIYQLIYVDDLLLIAEMQVHIDGMKEKVMKAFKSRNMGTPDFFLGLHLDRVTPRKELIVSQRQYVQRLVVRHGLADAKTTMLPMSPGAALHEAGTLLDQAGIERYQGLIGGLLYLTTCTRPDVSYPVGKLARYAARPTEEHEAASLRILRYLKGPARWGLKYAGRQPLLGYFDADCAGDVDLRRFKSGYGVLLHGAAISWSSKLQPTLAMSTTEA
eukprot:TRINITY_DN3365_c0_g1_i4.p1 TRINITY_DN3365_c0_g1~~TRINITY_DN3365_c0_g1_i4.p1  ORF type:complete len:603 (+),score=130.38 TRINITY_DN3365_c0_g1_i4:107-1810(+)